MNILSFQLHQKPLTLNHTHIHRGGRRFKSSKTRLYEEQFNLELEETCGPLLDQFSSGFCKWTQAIKVEVYIYVNVDEFFTNPPSKKSAEIDISRRSLDLDNCLKNSLDLIFKRLRLDDKYIVEINAKKIPTMNKPSMIFILEKILFPRVFNSFYD